MGIFLVDNQPRCAGEGVHDMSNDYQDSRIAEVTASVISESTDLIPIDARKPKEKNIRTKIEEDGREGAALLDSSLDEDPEGGGPSK